MAVSPGCEGHTDLQRLLAVRQSVLRETGEKKTKDRDPRERTETETREGEKERPAGIIECIKTQEAVYFPSRELLL